MTSKLFATTAIAAGMALWASTAPAATTLFIGAQEAGFNGGAITTLGSGASPLTLAGVSYGTFSITLVGGMGTPALKTPDVSLSDVFVTNSANGAAPFSKGTINIFLTETGLTSPVGPMKILSTLDYNMASGTLVMAGKTWYSNTDSLYTGTMIGNLGPVTAVAGTPSSTGAPFTINAANPLGTYSVTEEITITAPDSGPTGLDWASNSGMSLFAVPEPASLGLFGAGLFAFGAWRRRRNKKAAA